MDAGLIVIVSSISPFRAEREAARRLLGEGQFVEVFVATLLAVCRTLTQGTLRKGGGSKIKNFTGIDSAYEPPTDAELTLRTTESDASALALEVVRYLRDHGFTP